MRQGRRTQRSQNHCKFRIYWCLSTILLLINLCESAVSPKKSLCLKVCDTLIYSKRKSLKGALLFPLLCSQTKNCMHNKCMWLYGNLARHLILNYSKNPQLSGVIKGGEYLRFTLDSKTINERSLFTPLVCVVSGLPTLNFTAINQMLYCPNNENNTVQRIKIQRTRKQANFVKVNYISGGTHLVLFSGVL